jgi:hypothetical protein
MKKALILLAAVLSLAVFLAAQTHTEVTIEDAQTITGNKAFTGAMTSGKINGNCIVDGTANATLAAAITCASPNGDIYISANTVPAFVSATIPAGITLHFDSNSCLNNSGTLTINGPILAPDAQIFCGSGNISFGPSAAALSIAAVWFPGGDCGAKLNAASAAPGATSYVIVSTNCGVTITTALSLPAGTKLQFLAGRWRWNTFPTISTSGVEIGGVNWGSSFFDLGVATGDLFTVSGGVFKLHDLSIAACTVATCGTLITRTSGAVVNATIGGGGYLSNLYFTDVFRGFQSTTCPLGQWSLDTIRFQSAGGNWDSVIYGGTCNGTNLLNSYSFNNINGSLAGAGTVSGCGLICLDSGVDTWQFSNSDLTNNATGSTVPVLQMLKTGTSVLPRNVHFVNVELECGTACNALFIPSTGALDASFVNSNLSSSLRGCLIQGGTNIRFIGSQFINNQDEGCDITGGIDVSFIDDHFSDNSASSNNGFADLNFVGGVTNFKVIGNKFDQKYLGNANKASVGIQVQAGAGDHYVITGNEIDTTGIATPATPINNLGTGANQTVSGNEPSPVPTPTGTGACATFSTQSGNTYVGKFTCTAVTAASTITLTFNIAAPTGWNCSAQDQTTRANFAQETSSNTTSCTMTATSITQNDVFTFQASPF